MIIILLFSLLITFKRFFLTSDSEPDLPALKTLVESQIIASTPSSPISFNLWALIFSPINGLGSTFQSPVCRITPAGVFILSPLGSKIEWVKVIYSISKGSSFTVPFSSTILRSFVISICFSLNFSLIRTAVKGVAKILHFSLGHKWAMAPIWSSWACVKTIPNKLSFLSTIKPGSGYIKSTPGIVSSAKVTPISTITHLWSPGWP